MTYARSYCVINVHLLLVLALLCAALLAVVSVQPALADETFVVNSTADEGDANAGNGVCATTGGDCTLRAAIEEANALSDGVINLTIVVSMPGSYVLSEQLAIYGRNIFILGTGDASDVLIDGNELHRVFDISVGASVTVERMTLRGGRNEDSVVFPGHWHGGAIHNHGDLVLRDVTIRDSVIASDTPNPGAISCLTHCGGAIYNASNATLDNITFVNNANEYADAAAHGGAISNAATLLVQNATFISNSTAGGDGSALYSTGNADLTHLTVADNSTAAGAAIVNDGGALTLTASVVASNTGGNCGGVITDGGFNISYPDASCPGLNVDPLLSPAGLTDNGGPTPTVNLQPSSPAIDLIPEANCSLTGDQRGIARPQPNPGNCDAGAVEFVQTAQACMYAGSLSQVNSLDGAIQTTNACGRGTAIVLLDGGDYFACLYAGALSQFGTLVPTNCGRGEVYGFAAGTDFFACLYAGKLSQFGTVAPVNCGRGAPIGLMGPP